jgi:hypothetical protein
MERLYGKFCWGDRLTDEEVQHGIEHFRVLEEKLRETGDVFRLPANEAGRVLRGLESYRDSRRENKTWTLGYP